MRIRFWPHTHNTNIASFRIRCTHVSKGLTYSGLDSRIVKEPESADLLILSKRYDAKSLEKALRLRSNTGTKIALDICDNHFHNKATNDYVNQRQLQLKEALQSVDLVIASSAYLACELKQHVPDIRSLAIVDDIIEPPIAPAWHDRCMHPIAEIQLRMLAHSLNAISSERHHRLVWFGNAGGGLVDGGMENISLVRDQIEFVARSAPVSLTVISNSHQLFKRTFKNWSIPVFYIPWSRHSISRALELHGTSIIPIKRNPFTQSKTANRVTTSLVHGLAVIADSIPSYQAFAKLIHLDDWQNGLRLMTQSKEAWSTHSQLGLNSIQVSQHNQIIIEKWKEAFKMLLG